MIYRNEYNKELLNTLKIDCSKCKGFCCVALYFSKSDGFPKDKVGGTPCTNLKEDFTCKIHKDLNKKGLKGCTSYDCFGAGQKVSQITYKDKTWQKDSKLAIEMFDVFVIMRQLHEMLWYLCDALTFAQDEVTKNKLKTMIKKTEELTNLDGSYILNIDIENHRNKVNCLLKTVGEAVRKVISKKKSNKKPLAPGFDFIGANLTNTNLLGGNLAGSLLIAANLKDCDLSGAMVIGADMRDANLCGANLENCIFLTQSQINTAKGDSKTKLPKGLIKPSHWVR
ncbi:MAG: pentapeptide repeat-containing protein [Terrisporobacter sp.]|uniref:pentapeptide repeat-containing protein n=1 Tax=Clostridia TaxID=186801 RepID=UPI002FC90219